MSLSSSFTNILSDLSSEFHEYFTCTSRDTGGISRRISRRAGLVKSAANSRGMTGLNGAGASRLTDLTPPLFFCPMFMPRLLRVRLWSNIVTLYERRRRSKSRGSKRDSTTRGDNGDVDEMLCGRRRSLDLNTGPRPPLYLFRVNSICCRTLFIYERNAIVPVLQRNPLFVLYPLCTRPEAPNQRRRLAGTRKLCNPRQGTFFHESHALATNNCTQISEIAGSRLHGTRTQKTNAEPLHEIIVGRDAHGATFRHFDQVNRALARYLGLRFRFIRPVRTHGYNGKRTAVPSEGLSSTRVLPHGSAATIPVSVLHGRHRFRLPQNRISPSTQCGTPYPPRTTRCIQSLENER